MERKKIQTTELDAIPQVGDYILPKADDDTSSEYLLKVNELIWITLHLENYVKIICGNTSQTLQSRINQSAVAY